MSDTLRARAEAVAEKRDSTLNGLQFFSATYRNIGPVVAETKDGTVSMMDLDSVSFIMDPHR